MIQVIEMRPWHLMSVALNMRKADVDELAAVGIETDPQRWACRQVLRSGVSFACLLGDIPVACFGVMSERAEYGEAWIVLTARGAASKRVNIACRKAFSIIVESGGYGKIAAVVRSSNPGAVRVAEWFGFKRDEGIRIYSMAGGAGASLARNVRRAAQRKSA